jgi:AraC-like DNA-binding protein
MPYKSVSVAQYFIIGIILLALYNICYKLSYINGQVVVVNNLWNPSWMLFGPLFHFAVATGIQKKKLKWQALLHLIPALVCTAFYLTSRLWQGNNEQLSQLINRYNGLFILVLLSLVCYVVVWLPTLKKQALEREGSSDLFFLLATFFGAIVLMGSLMYCCQHIMKIETGVSYYNYIISLLVALAVFTTTFLLVKPQASFEMDEGETSAYAKSPLKPELIKFYIQKIESHFKNEQSFLQNNITLYSLSEELNIPKQHLTQIFNVHLKKSFYVYLAVNRIEYALSLIHSGNCNMKLEALAYECGFSSKTSFNKYFKAVTGLSPMAYLHQKVQA